FSLDKFTTTARFDAKGHLHFQAPMFTEKSTLTWILPDHTTCRRSVTFSKYQETFVAAVLWTGPIDLDLRVVEPGAAIGASSGYAAREQPNADLRTGLGAWRSFGGSDPAGPRIQYYSILGYQPTLRGQTVSFFVQFTSRQNPAQEPFCGDAELATARYHMYLLHYGRVQLDRQDGFAPRRCGESVADPILDLRRYDMRL
ncbi:MAG: hypothetical protein JO163_11380, partial [Methylobacteriaceae bacterium]|nr:hypothetical protein [Methylobacteriaceae bacterium]